MNEPINAKNWSSVGARFCPDHGAVMEIYRHERHYDTITGDFTYHSLTLRCSIQRHWLWFRGARCDQGIKYDLKSNGEMGQYGITNERETLIPDYMGYL